MHTDLITVCPILVQRPGIKPVSLALQEKFLTTGSLEKVSGIVVILLSISEATRVNTQNLTRTAVLQSTLNPLNLSSKED